MAKPQVLPRVKREVRRDGLRGLECLYAVAEIFASKRYNLGEASRQVAERLRQAFPSPKGCSVRIRIGRNTFLSPEFRETKWRHEELLGEGGTPLGFLEAFLANPKEHRRDDPFNMEQKRLLKSIAQILTHEIGKGKRRKTAPQPKAVVRPEWQIILDLLDETDTALHKRVVRRLMNHLSHLGAPGVQGLVMEFDPLVYAVGDADTRGSNQPLPKRDEGVPRRVFAEIVRLAAIVMPEEEITLLVKQWIRQDKLGFFALSTEKRNISLSELSEIVHRFCREVSEEESALSPSDDMNVRVALTRRFLTERLSFVAVAKKYLSVHDFDRLLTRVAGPAHGIGTIGGKAAGLILAKRILEREGRGNPLLENIRLPKAWFLTSDGLFDFVHYNSLEDTQSLKYQTIEEIRHNYPYMEQVFKNSFFSPEMVNQLKMVLEDLGDFPLIVRSSSLLEDSEGSAFSGKYRSLFLVNTGTREERLEALMDAIAEVYASIFGPDPIQYRKERGLLDFMEEMGVMVMRVVGTRVGKYYFPAFAGVAFSTNEFRWSPRLKREDGVVRLVTGLGTRAVDRVGEDFPLMVSPGQPGLRVNTTPEQVAQYAQRYMDVLNLESGRFESPEVDTVIREADEEFPQLYRIVSEVDRSMLHKPVSAMFSPGGKELAVTFAGLLEDTEFLQQVREVTTTLEAALGTPVDLEFAHDGENLHILQCRPQSRASAEQQVVVPTWVPEERKLFSANRFVSTAAVRGIRHLVFVDPEAYRELPSAEEMLKVAEGVGRVNQLLPRREFILMGPGRWGSRGDITLGVRVSYADINNTAMLVEIGKSRGGSVPDLSFGTHFFQDLVEAKIRYLALYPDDEGVVYKETFFKKGPNRFAELVPEMKRLAKVIRVIPIQEASGFGELQIMMDGDSDQALAYLTES